MNKRINKWCDGRWLIFGCWITTLMTILILVYWKSWSDELKVFAAIAALIPIHAIEEWIFPGGFQFQYNMFLHKSELPDRYPLCRKSDMIINLSVTFIYMLITFIAVLLDGNIHTGLVMATIIFCILEVLVHSFLGTMGYFKYRKQGKTTIYGPGSMTAYFGFGVLGVILFYSMQGQIIYASDWIICAVSLIILLCWIFIPEYLIKKKDTEFIFKTNGYYERYLQ